MKTRTTDKNGRPAYGVGAVERLRRKWIEPHGIYLIVAVHLMVFLFSYVSAYYVRFEFAVPAEMWRLFWLTLPWMVALKLNVFYLCGHCLGWRYVTFADLMVLLRAAGCSAVLLAAINHFLLETAYSIPRSIILLDFSTSILLLGGIRCLFRISRQRPLPKTRQRRAVIVGADDSGLALAQHIQAERRLNYRIVGFLDSDGASNGSRCGSIPVLGGLDAVSQIAATHAVQEVLVTAGRLPGINLRYLMEKSSEANVTVKVIPAVEELLNDRNGARSGSKHHLHVRDVEINDLLHREPIELDDGAIGELLRGETVLVTGAGGCIGSEICRQLLRFHPKSLVLIERAENNLFHIHRELEGLTVATRLVPNVADVLDRRRMASLLERLRPSVVFHAAAHKHVPLMECNPGEAVRNNVLGTKRLADLADRCGVRHFVFISTDKAVHPCGVMGATKQLAERYVHALAVHSLTKFVVVRFGNVLGSTGSVVPIFREQIRAGGPITVTHPEMQRYFMTVSEASQLVLQAAAMGKGGEIFELEMGEPVKIVDLARDMIRLSGLPVDAIPITFTGTRAGEKLFEELYFDDEETLPTSHRKLRAAYARPTDLGEVRAIIARLAKYLHDPNDQLIQRRLQELVAEPRPTDPESLLIPDRCTPKL